jgi:hypothetical protein
MYSVYTWLTIDLEGVTMYSFLMNDQQYGPSKQLYTAEAPSWYIYVNRSLLRGTILMYVPVCESILDHLCCLAHLPNVLPSQAYQDRVLAQIAATTLVVTKSI